MISSGAVLENQQRNIAQAALGGCGLVIIDPHKSEGYDEVVMKQKITTDKAPKASGPFSQAIEENGFVFTSGQIYLTPEDKLLEGTIEEQVHQVMKNLGAVLEAAGTSFKNVVKTTIYVTDMSLYGKVNEVYGSYMSDPYPARETICVKELPRNAKVEISMVATK